jgi:predicted nucleic acid-binding protein
MVKAVFVDAGVLVALLSARDQYHEWAVGEAGTMPLPWLTTEAVLSETWHRVVSSPKARGGLIAMLRRGALGFPISIPSLLADLCLLLEKFDDLPSSVADAGIFLMAARTPGAVIWTTDSNFRVYRLRGSKTPDIVLPE